MAYPFALLTNLEFKFHVSESENRPSVKIIPTSFKLTFPLFSFAIGNKHIDILVYV